jgi:hypothetical protein
VSFNLKNLGANKTIYFSEGEEKWFRNLVLSDQEREKRNKEFLE